MMGGSYLFTLNCFEELAAFILFGCTVREYADIFVNRDLMCEYRCYFEVLKIVVSK